MVGGDRIFFSPQKNMRKPEHAFGLGEERRDMTLGWAGFLDYDSQDGNGNFLADDPAHRRLVDSFLLLRRCAS